MTDDMLDDMGPDMLDDADIELITDYLSHQLSLERVTEVECRLEEDEAFRKLAAPLVLAWSIPPRWKRQPMARVELEAMWDDFTKRVGFVEQRPKARRRLRKWVMDTAVAFVKLLMKILP